MPALSKFAKPDQAETFKCAHKRREGDPHEICEGCRKSRNIQLCDWDNRCCQCRHLSNDEFAAYLKGREANDAKLAQRKAKDPKASSAPPEADGSGDASLPPAASAVAENFAVENLLQGNSDATQDVPPETQPDEPLTTAAEHNRALRDMSFRQILDAGIDLPNAYDIDLHPGTYQLAQQSTVMFDLPLRQVSAVAYSNDNTQAYYQAVQPSPSTPAASTSGAKRSGKRVSEKPPLRIPTPKSQDGDEESSDEEEAGSTAEDTVCDTSVEESVPVPPGMTEMFRFIAEQTGLSCESKQREPKAIKSTVQQGKGTDTTHLNLSLAPPVIKAIRQRLEEMSKEKTRELGKLFAQSTVLKVGVTPYDTPDDVWPSEAPKLVGADDNWIPIVAKGAKMSITWADAMQIESMMRTANLVAGALDSTFAALAAQFTSPMVDDPMFKLLFEHVGRAIADIVKSTTNASTSLMQVLTVNKTGGGSTAVRIRIVVYPQPLVSFLFVVCSQLRRDMVLASAKQLTDAEKRRLRFAPMTGEQGLFPESDMLEVYDSARRRSNDALLLKGTR